MKRFLVMLALAPTLAAANELSVGTFQLSGNSNLGFSTQKTKITGFEDTTDTTFNLSGSGLYYVTPMVGIGAVLEYDHTTEKSGGVETKMSTLLIGPKVGLDFPVAPQLAVYADGDIGYASADVEGHSATGFGFGLGAGLKYFIVPAVSADLGLQYRYVKVSESGVDLKVSDFGLAVGLSVYFGGAPAHH